MCALYCAAFIWRMLSTWLFLRSYSVRESSPCKHVSLFLRSQISALTFLICYELFIPIIHLNLSENFPPHKLSLRRLFYYWLIQKSVFFLVMSIKFQRRNVSIVLHSANVRVAESHFLFSNWFDLFTFFLRYIFRLHLCNVLTSPFLPIFSCTSRKY